ncbi:MAG: hypothetical protein M0R30_12280 [Methanoregula sp.]|nr:hypothetical protein [Methanoregula sp.]MCK9632401.1 hypothetical protein [Methanoregula sp.]
MTAHDNPSVARSRVISRIMGQGRWEQDGAVPTPGRDASAPSWWCEIIL